MRLRFAALLGLVSVVVCAIGARCSSRSSPVDGGTDSDGGDASSCDVSPTGSCDGGWCVLRHGCFWMGSPESEPGRGRYSENIHLVTLTHDVEIMQHEVTQGAWTDAGLPDPTSLGDGGVDYALHHPDAPVGNVTFSDAHAYANLLSKRHVPQLPECYTLASCTGGLGADLHCATILATVADIYECRGYRLPTEAEWEYAARGGTTSAYYTGNTTGATACEGDPALDMAAWYCNNSGFKTHIVGSRLPNAVGLFDMLGNAGEWVEDKFNGLGYGDAAVDPGGTLVENTDQTVRGGFVTAPPAGCRAANRFEVGDPPILRGGAIGVRLVRTLDVSADGGG